MRCHALLSLLLILTLSVVGVSCSNSDESFSGVEQSEPIDGGQSITIDENSKIDWNDLEIEWLSYEDGLSTAKEQNKPTLILFYTDWCPHCQRYSSAFQNSEVVKLAQEFVMIRVNRDDAPEINELYAPDGGYVPRTVVLSPDGSVNEKIHGANPNYRYFLNTFNPDELWEIMFAAIAAHDTN